jgi:hypothetical protein
MFQQQHPSVPQSDPQQAPLSQVPPSGVQGYQDPLPQSNAPQQQKAPERDQFAAKFHQLSQREKQLRELENSLKERGSKVESLESAFARANDDPFGLLQELNLDVERLYEVKKGGGKFAPGEMQVRQLKSEVDKLREQIAAKERAEQEASQRRAQEEALASFKQNVSNSLQSSEKYELSKARNAIDDVMDLMADHYSKTSEMLDIDQALEQVEKRYEAEVQKLVQTNKVKQMFRQLGLEAPQESSFAPRDGGGPQVSRTLTNSMTAQTAPATGELTSEQRLKRAIALLERGSY